MPILVISARGREADKIEALDAGADDYLTKPFGAGELLARLRVALRHAREVAAGTRSRSSTFGDISVDLARRVVTRGGAEVHLTPIEYKLLVALLRHAGKVVTHRQLLKEVWGPEPGEPGPLPARLHGAAPAQARGGSDAAAVFPDRAGRGVSARDRLTRSFRDACRPRSRPSWRGPRATLSAPRGSSIRRGRPRRAARGSRSRGCAACRNRRANKRRAARILR